MPAPARPAPARCESCDLLPPIWGVGFPTRPGANPGLPDDLRGAFLWVCGWPGCEDAARARAAANARARGVTRAALTRVFLFPTPEPGGRRDPSS